MLIERTNLEGVLLLTPEPYYDSRGWFMESFCKKKLAELGILADFVQDNHSYSAYRGTLRGLHFQNRPHEQAKLVRCTRGAIKDVAVDIRKGSSTYGQYYAAILSEQNKKQLYIPRGFAHGFITLTDNVEVQYKTDNFYHYPSDRSISYKDSFLNIDWGQEAVVISDKDKNAPKLSESDANLSKRVLVTGAEGRLGRAICKRLKAERYDYLGLGKSKLDITNAYNVNAVFKKFKPEIVIHCAAYTNVDRAELEQDKCFAVNAQGTYNIAAACQRAGSTLIYISTDYVYDGKTEGLVNEDFPANPMSVYGKSKLLAEEHVKKLTDKHYIFRVQWLFGEGESFAKAVYNLGLKQADISAAVDQLGTPTYIDDLCKVIMQAFSSQKYGVYNVGNEDFCSRYELAKHIIEKCKLNAKISAVYTNTLNLLAKRPLNARLSKQKLYGAGFSPLRSWTEAIDFYLEQLKKEEPII